MSGAPTTTAATGTTTLFAALEVATGRITDTCQPRHRHREFLAFLKLVARACPRRQLHAVLDNYATHPDQILAKLNAGNTTAISDH